MNASATCLPGVLLLQPAVHRDARGHFVQTWSEASARALGLPPRFVQDNVSVSHRGVLRGLHLQSPNAQGKLVSVLHGAAYDVAVDVRRGSPTSGQWVGVVLSAENAQQLYIPEGFAHGFVALEDATVLAYKCTRPYDPAGEVALAWDDPDFGIDWPVGRPLLSPRDAAAPRWRVLPGDRLPAFAP